MLMVMVVTEKGSTGGRSGVIQDWLSRGTTTFEIVTGKRGSRYIPRAAVQSSESHTQKAAVFNCLNSLSPSRKLETEHQKHAVKKLAYLFIILFFSKKA